MKNHSNAEILGDLFVVFAQLKRPQCVAVRDKMKIYFIYLVRPGFFCLFFFLLPSFCFLRGGEVVSPQQVTRNRFALWCTSSCQVCVCVCACDKTNIFYMNYYTFRTNSMDN